MHRLKSDKPLERAAPPPLAYSPNDAAKAIGVSRAFLYKMIAAGNLKVSKLGSRTLIRHDELVQFLENLAA